MFGRFDFICTKVPLPLCQLVGPYTDGKSDPAEFLTHGIMTQCYSRSVELANTMIYAIGNEFIHITALLCLVLIIVSVWTKYTAIGRVELLFSIYLYTLLTFMSLVVDAGVAAPGSSAFAYLSAIQNGFTSALCWSMVVNGLLGFQLWEDGTRASQLFTYLSSAVAWALTFIISLLTYKGWGGSAMNPSNTVGLFVVLYVLNAIFVATYVVSQLVLSIYVLRSLWSVGAVCLGAVFFIAGQILMYVFSNDICVGVKHYIDGVFFATFCNLCAIMMYYKHWDMITQEDLEFSVSNKESNWDTKDFYDDSFRDYNGSDYAGSTYALNQHPY